MATGIEAAPESHGYRHREVSLNQPLKLTFTDTGAEQVMSYLTRNRSRSRSSRADWGWDVKDEAADKANSSLAAAEVHIGLRENHGRQGEPIYQVWLKKPTDKDSLVLLVAAKTDCLLIIGASRNPLPPIPAAVRIKGPVRFGDDEQPLPSHLVAACARERDDTQMHADVERHLEAWRAFLTVEETAARKNEFSLQYRAMRPGGHHHDRRLTLLGLTPKLRESLQSNRRDRLEILARGGEEVVAQVHFRRLLGGDVCEVRIESETRRDLERTLKALPKAGVLRNRESGTLTSIERQKSAIRKLTEGRAHLPALDRLLYADETPDLPHAEPVQPIEPNECLHPERINEQQRLAVAQALATPDCYFLQGPPGTGKTTVIAELCYQAVKRGRRVLVSSQTNLAVDNALSRLECRPEILAQRIGREDRVEAEGLPFVGDAAIHRWLEGVAQRALENVERFRRRGRTFDEVWPHIELVRNWCRRGAPEPERATDDVELVDLLARHAAFEQVRHPLETARRALAELRKTRDEIRAEENRYEALLARQTALEALAAGRVSADLAAACPPRTAALLRNLDRLDAIIAGKERDDHTPSCRIATALRRWERAELTGDWEAARTELDRLARAITASERRARWPVLGFALFRRLHARSEAAALDLARSAWLGVIRGTAPWHFVREEVARDRERVADDLRRCRKTLNSLERSLAAANNWEGDAFAPARAGLVDLGIPVPPESPLESAEAAFGDWERRRDAAEDDAAESLWRELVSAGLVSESDCRSAADTALERMNADRSPQAPSRATRVADLLAKWASYLEEGRHSPDDALRTAFDSAVNVVGATCSITASKDFLERFHHFDLVIVDEVSKATATELLLPCLLGSRVVLVGDHQQLAPVLGDQAEGASYETAAAELGMEREELTALLRRSLFKERFEHFDAAGDSGRCLMLQQQYRMHSQIMRGINQFYEGRLRMGWEEQDDARAHGIHDLPWLPPKASVVWVDEPQDPEWESTLYPGSHSMMNEREAEVVARIVRQLGPRLLDRQLSLGVISLYRGQERVLRDHLDRLLFSSEEQDRLELRASTVDRFQGMERDVIILSLCANGRRPSSFLRTPNRINVAMSRARRLLVIVGSVATFRQQGGGRNHYGTFHHVAQENGAAIHAADILD